MASVGVRTRARGKGVAVGGPGSGEGGLAAPQPRGGSAGKAKVSQRAEGSPANNANWVGAGPAIGRWAGAGSGTDVTMETAAQWERQPDGTLIRKSSLPIARTASGVDNYSDGNEPQLAQARFGDAVSNMAVQQELVLTMRRMCMTLDEIKVRLRKDSERFTSTGILQPPTTEERLRRIATPEAPLAKRIVYCRFNIFNLHDVDVKESTVKAHLYYELAWELAVEDQVTSKKNDSDAGGDPEDDSPSNWDKEWQPQVGLTDFLGDLGTQREWLCIGHMAGRRMAIKRWIGEGTFLQTFDFRKFPYDSHDFVIKVRSDLTKDKVALVDKLELFAENERETMRKQFKGSIASVSKFQLSQYWEFDSIPEVQQVAFEKGQEGERPRLQVVLSAKRIPYYFIANIGVMMFLIVSLAFTMFALPVVQLADRLNVVMTLVLSAVAFKLLCAEQLPELPYLTALDRYVLWGLAVLCLMALECVLVEHLASEDTKEWWDSYAGYTLTVVWGLSNVPAISGTFSRGTLTATIVVTSLLASLLVIGSLETGGWWHRQWNAVLDGALHAVADPPPD